jgi:Tetratricopeptide repeat
MSLPPEARQQQGRAMLERLLPLARQRFGADHPVVLTATNNLAQIVGDGGDRRRERELYTQLIASQRRVLGEQHPHTLISYHNLGRSHVRSQEFEQALAWTGLAHEGALKMLGEAHPFVCTFGGMRATALAGAGRRDPLRRAPKGATGAGARQHAGRARPAGAPVRPGLPGGTRTPDLRLRRPLLYPVELRAVAAIVADLALSAAGTGRRRTASRAPCRR